MIGESVPLVRTRRAPTGSLRPFTISKRVAFTLGTAMNDLLMRRFRTGGAAD